MPTMCALAVWRAIGESASPPPFLGQQEGNTDRPPECSNSDRRGPGRSEDKFQDDRCDHPVNGGSAEQVAEAVVAPLQGFASSSERHDGDASGKASMKDRG
jgi:hypothetical protein